MKNITVLGCGVIGLTTAICLEKAGFQVKIIAKNLHFKTTSAIAAAIWMPFKADPIELVNQWSLETYHILEKQSKDLLTGVKMVDFIALSPTDKTPPWAGAMPDGFLRKANKKELPPSYSYGFVAKVPIIETPIYLEYLFDEFRGEIILDEVLDLAEVCNQESIVINCTGLGAKQLIDDPLLYPVRGQIVKVQAQPDFITIANDDPDNFFYIVPRKDCIVLGGTTEANNYSLKPNDFFTQQIIERTKKIAPDIQNLPILKVEVGLRPYRSSIRLEKEKGKNLIHNYGHGGSGFTVSWGCANAVLKMVRTLSKDPLRN